MTDNKKEVAITIMQQIEAGYSLVININGTSHKISFFKTIGAKDFSYDENSLRFTARVGGKGHQNKKVIIRLNDMDTYDIEIWTARINRKTFDIDKKKIAEINDVYNDQLTQVLQKELGL